LLLPPPVPLLVNVLLFSHEKNKKKSMHVNEYFIRSGKEALMFKKFICI